MMAIFCHGRHKWCCGKNRSRVSSVRFAHFNGVFALPPPTRKDDATLTNVVGLSVCLSGISQCWTFCKSVVVFIQYYLFLFVEFICCFISSMSQLSKCDQFAKEKGKISPTPIPSHIMFFSIRLIFLKTLCCVTKRKKRKRRIKKLFRPALREWKCWSYCMMLVLTQKHTQANTFAHFRWCWCSSK